MLSPFGRDGEAIELARQPDGEIADVDYLLNLAKTFRDNFADLNRDQSAQSLLVGARFFAKQPYKFAALRRGHQSPGAESRVRRFNCRDSFARACFLDLSDGFAGDGRMNLERTIFTARSGHAEFGKQTVNFARKTSQTTFFAGNEFRYPLFGKMDVGCGSHDRWPQFLLRIRSLAISTA